jgi:hypothetical protein
MSIKTIVETAQAKVTEMGGGEQSIGKMFDLAATCDVHGEDGVFEWMADLGEALDKVGLQLTSGAGRPQDLYAKPKED